MTEITSSPEPVTAVTDTTRRETNGTEPVTAVTGGTVLGLDGKVLAILAPRKVITCSVIRTTRTEHFGGREHRPIRVVPGPSIAEMFKKGVSAARRDFHEERLPDKLAKMDLC